MDITKQPYKHLKIDKFVFGSKQKIIKTTTQIIDIDEENKKTINYQNDKKNVYYLSDNHQNLIDFHDVNFDYINNKRSNLKLKSYNDNYNPYFQTTANIIKHQSTQEDGQRITYFPQYIYTPLDITQFKNSCYILLPISTNKFINIAHPNKILNEVKSFEQKSISNNFSKLSSNIDPHLYFYNKPAYTSEDNSIPVYDMNFKQLQTIKFPSTSELYIWLMKWGLQNVLYKDDNGDYHALINQILFDSLNNLSFDQLASRNLTFENCDSILLEPFINYIMNKHYLYSRDTLNKMLGELFANISTATTERYFKLVGKINNLNDKLFEPISSALYEQGVYNAKDLVYKKQDVTFDETVLPQNTLLIDSIQDSLEYDKNKEEVEYLPSCYVNYINLKNNRDPQYQLNCTIKNVKITNEIFTTDYRFSTEYNSLTNSSKYLSSLNEQMTLQIVNKAVQCDNDLSSVSGYVEQFPQRMSVKQQFYLNQYDNKHLCVNTMYNMGTLNGIRNYLQVGTSFGNKTWLSYNYNEDKQNKIIVYNDKYTFQFNGKIYDLKYDYDENNFITDFYLINNNVNYYIRYNDILKKFYPARYDNEIEILDEYVGDFASFDITESNNVNNDHLYVKIKSSPQKVYKEEGKEKYYFQTEGVKVYLNLENNNLFCIETQTGLEYFTSDLTAHFEEYNDVYYINTDFYSSEYDKNKSIKKFLYVKINSEKQLVQKEEDRYYYYDYNDGEKIYLNLTKKHLFFFDGQNEKKYYFTSKLEEQYLNKISTENIYYLDAEFCDGLYFNNEEITPLISTQILRNDKTTSIVFESGQFKENNTKIVKDDIEFEKDNYAIYKLPFYSYSLDRDSHWIKNYYGENRNDCVMKSFGIECPWESIFTGTQSGIIGCSLSEAQQCNGFCTFPCNGQIKKSNNNNLGLNWKLSQYYDLFKGLEDVKQKMNNGLDLSNNNEWFVIPAAHFEQLILAEKDISINDDLEVFVTSTDISTRVKFNDFVASITPEQELKSIFQGFWNGGKWEEYRYTDSNYTIASNSKFNGPHIITKDTIITCYDIDNEKRINYIPKNSYCLMRVKSWWSDVIRCEGSIRVIQNISNTEQNNVKISNYDFIETVDGFFKFKQSGLHKSNIYSINLKNTGLSKGEDKEVKYYTKEEAITLLQKKYFIKYYKEQDSFLIHDEQNTFMHSIYDSTDNTVFKRTPLFKNLEQNNLNGFVLNYITVPFKEVIKYQGLSMLINEQFEELYYYADQLQEATEYNNTRQNIRQLIEQAIRKSIIRYMPADTNLWKVEFED